MKKHPVIAITGSSGAGTSTVKATFVDVIKVVCMVLGVAKKKNPGGVKYL